MRGIRFRATAFVSIVLGLALLGGGAILATVLRSQLIDNLDATLVAAADGRATLIAADADPSTLTDTRLEESTVWIGTADGATLATGGRKVVGDAPTTQIGTLTHEVAFEESHDDGQVEIEREELRLHVVAATSPTHGDVLVIVGSELEVVDRPVKKVITVLLIGSPILILIVGVLTWVTADRALRPVGRIRSDAARISAHHDDATIDVPTTGDEIEALAQTVNDMLERLAENDQRQRQFVGDASHELKSPLANLRIDIETGGGDPETTARHLSQIDRLAALVDDLLALARHDEGQVARSDSVDLDDLVFDALGAAAPRHDHRVVIDDVEPTRVIGDPAQLRGLVRNLIDNAIRHAEHQIALTLSRDGSSVVLHVDDDGAGVPPADREQIFERFARTDDARDRHAGGTGLGLAIVRRVADAHGGDVEVTDSPLGGARFTVSFEGSV